jgi:cation transport ATPase
MACVRSLQSKLTEIPEVISAEVNLEPPKVDIHARQSLDQNAINTFLEESGIHYRVYTDENVEAAGHSGHSPPTHVPEGAYYCPMLCEGEKVYPQAGDCPVCGMELERAANNVSSAEEDAALSSMKRRFLIALIFTIPVFLIAMGEMIGIPIHSWLPQKTWGWR